MSYWKPDQPPTPLSSDKPAFVGHGRSQGGCYGASTALSVSVVSPSQQQQDHRPPSPLVCSSQAMPPRDYHPSQGYDYQHTAQPYQPWYGDRDEVGQLPRVQLQSSQQPPQQQQQQQQRSGRYSATATTSSTTAPPPSTVSPLNLRQPQTATGAPESTLAHRLQRIQLNHVSSTPRYGGSDTMQSDSELDQKKSSVGDALDSSRNPHRSACVASSLVTSQMTHGMQAVSSVLSPPQTPDAQGSAAPAFPSASPTPSIQPVTNKSASSPTGANRALEHGRHPLSPGDCPDSSALQLAATLEPGVAVCISTPETFSTTWYAHPDVPGFDICSRCYEDFIRGTMFENNFSGRFESDGKPRFCRFSRPRVREHLFRVSIAMKKLDDLLRYMQKRTTVPDCQGLTPVTGTKKNPPWYTAVDNAIPNMVVCQACYEDHVMSRHFAARFTVFPKRQAEGEAWTCDFARPFVRKQYYSDVDVNDWANFCKRISERLDVPTCPKSDVVGPGYSSWYAPVEELDMFSICQACHYDFVLHSGGEEEKWHPTDEPNISDGGFLCDLGQINVMQALMVADELKDFSIFWKAAKQVNAEPLCRPEGMRNAKWYTHPSISDGFNLCGRCLAGVAEPLGVAHLFVPKAETGTNAQLLCSFNSQDDESETYLSKARESFYKRDPTILEKHLLEHVNKLQHA